jgi:dTMP kinase
VKPPARDTQAVDFIKSPSAPSAARGTDDTSGSASASASDPDMEATLTVPLPPRPPVPPVVGAADETTVLPPVAPARGAWDETAVLPAVPAGGSRDPGPADETAVLPAVRLSGPSGKAETTPNPRATPKPPATEGASDETAVLPSIRDARRGDDPADRVPPDFFRDRPAPSASAAPSPRPAGGSTRPTGPTGSTASTGRRPRSDWAEETPLDDLPSLADELLGPYDEDGGGGGRRG